MKTGMTETIGGNMIVERIQFAAARFPAKRMRASAYAAGTAAARPTSVEASVTMKL